MKVTSLRYLNAKFHHPSLGASPPNRGKSICLPPELSLLLKRQSVNKFRHRYSMLWRLAIPALAGLLVPSGRLPIVFIRDAHGAYCFSWQMNCWCYCCIDLIPTPATGGGTKTKDHKKLKFHECFHMTRIPVQDQEITGQEEH